MNKDIGKQITDRIFFLNTQCKVMEDYKEQVNKMIPDYAYYKLVFNVLNSSFTNFLASLHR